MAEESGTAVYVSWPTFKNAIEHLAEGIPNQVDRTAFPGMSGGVQSQLLSGLKFLGLITADHQPTDALHDLAVPDETVRKERLKALLQERYSELFALNLVKATPQQLGARMGEAYNVSGDTKEKAIRFFLSAASYVGVELSRLFKISASPSGAIRARRRSPNRARSTALVDDDNHVENQKPPAGMSRSVKLKSGGTLTLQASVDIMHLTIGDRAFLFKLIDAMTEYERAEAEVPTAQK